jgi:hypothetical protein
MNMLVRAAAAALIVASLAAPAQAQYRGGAPSGPSGNDQSYGSPHEMPHDDVPHPRSLDAGSKAEDLRLKGHCDQAIPLLRGIVDDGGSEIAQFNLGLCLLDVAATDTQHAADLKKEGTEWIVAAADAGLARAQSRAVSLLMDSDPVEAQKWAILYRGNPTRYSFGLPDLPDDVTGRLDKALTGLQKAEARKRANAWLPKVAATEE